MCCPDKGGLFHQLCLMKVDHGRNIFSTENHLSKQALHLWGMYTTWKVDGATPLYWFIMAPYYSPPDLGVAIAIYFHKGVV